MHVLGIGVIDDGCEHHADARGRLGAWLKIARDAKWQSLADVRQSQRDTDCVEGQTIFNIGGNKYRLYTTINYETETVIVKEFLTHAEYSRRG